MKIHPAYHIVRLAALSVILLLATTNAGAQNTKQIEEALQKSYTISKIISGERDAFPEESPADFLTGAPENYAYIVTYGYVKIVKGTPLYFDQVAILSPGTRRFVVRYFREYATGSSTAMRGNMMVTTTTWRTEKSEDIPISVDLQPGKYYTFQEKITKIAGVWDQKEISISLQEVTDPKTIERAKAKTKDIIEKPNKYMAGVVTAQDYKNYLEWWKTHAGTLNGTFVSKDGKTQIRFEDDRFMAYNTQSLLATTTFVYGTYCFDKQTIILQADSVKKTTVAALRSKPGTEQVTVRKLSHVLSYELNGINLTIHSQEGDLMFPFPGEFTKQRDDDTAGAVAEPSGGGSGNVTASGKATLDIDWRVEDGTLVVSGKGEVPGNPSWSSAIDKYTSAVIGDGITVVGHHAFAMTKITSLVLGKNVTSLNGYALFNCNNLTTVEMRNPVPPKVGAFAFMGTPVGKAKLIVPAGSKAAYQKNSDWKKFGTIEERQ